MAIYYATEGNVSGEGISMKFVVCVPRLAAAVQQRIPLPNCVPSPLLLRVTRHFSFPRSVGATLLGKRCRDNRIAVNIP